ncbi:hypothetical protein Si121_00381 [Streptococcus infantarius subsp. infantarius]|nr:hypothetical protein [Streptococcus infantarius subsp. infantarius]
MTNKVPNIRFKGFTDDWEQRKLLDVTESIKNGYTYKADGNRDHKYKVTRIESISSGVINVEKLGSSDEINKDYKLIDGDILFSHINSLSHIGNTAMYTTDLGNIYHGMNLLNIRAKQDIVNSHFLLRLLKKDSSRNWFRIIAKPAVNQASISVADVGSFEFLMPNIAEQQKIGEYFSNLDHLITLHQRKCEQTKELKKFMLQKMFPKKGEKNPEIRFPGFTDDWEQRKLIDYLEVSKEKNKNEVFGKEDVLSVSGDYGIVNQIEFQGRSFAGASVAPYGIVDTGDIVYTKSPLKSNPYGIIKANKGKAGIVSTLYAVYKPLDNVCSDFVQIYFEQDARMNNYMHPLVNKGAKNDMKVSDVNALKGEVCFPSKDEQIKISEHFANLDRLITLHQRKCEQLKELKKFMLQNMFPKKG